MKSLTKTELKWVYSAMEYKTNTLYDCMNKTKEPASVTLIKHEIECLESTMEKINDILASGTKRIEIK